MFFEKKICSIDTFLSLREGYRQAGKSVVVVSGSFDVLHAGHLHMLDDAKGQGDVLVVLVNSDRSVRSYKGPSRPFMSEAHRVSLIAALGIVDHVILFDELTPIRALSRIKPDIFCNGPDWGKDCIERDVVEAGGGVVYVHPTRSYSSSDIISRIQAAKDTPTKKAVFFDRDGVLIEDRGYVHSVKDVSFMPGVFESLQLLQNAKYELFVITNQSGIGRGMYTVSDMQAVHDHMNAEFSKHGITISGFYFCPHTPDDGCECRKPGTALLTRAAAEHTLSLDKSWIVGDKPSDVECGRLANAKAILIQAQGAVGGHIRPNFTVHDIREAVRVILNTQ